MPIVSIIIPAYNKRDYICDTLESCKNQTYSDFEVIIIDDCSTDDTVSKIKEFVAKNNSLPIKLFENEENKGVSYSRNYGISEATGKYVLFLDADDVLHPDALSLLYETALMYKGDIIFSQRVYFTGKHDSDNELNHNKFSVKEMFSPPQYIAGGLIQKEIIDQYKLHFEPELSNGEDTLFAATLFCFSNKCFYLCQPLYLIRRDDRKSLSRGQWNNPNIEIPRETNVLRYMELYYTANSFKRSAEKGKAITIIRKKKNAVKDLIIRYNANTIPLETKYRLPIIDILLSNMKPVQKIIELLYRLPGIESLRLFRVLMLFKRNYVVMRSKRG